MNNLESKVLNFINNNNLLVNTDKVYVATSGGADSMALLAFMYYNKSLFNIEVAAVHVNHGIRGLTAERDANFVKEYCLSNNIEYILFDANKDRVDVPNNASEEWARNLRYTYFSKLNGHNIKIATAHTLSDQAETFLFRVTRGGCGLNGLSGIPVQRENYIRPFLCLTRAETEELTEYYNTGYIIDETNLGDKYSRNKLRHKVIPELKVINPQVEESINKICERAKAAQEFISKYAHNLLENNKENEYTYSINCFKNQDDVIVNELISQILSKALDKVRENHITTIFNCIRHSDIDTNSTKENLLLELELTQEKRLVLTNKFIAILDYKENNKEKTLKLGENSFGLGVKVTKLTYSEFISECKTKYDLCKYADADKLNLDNCLLRFKTTGDRFKPACKTGGKVSKFTSNFSVAERYLVPLVVVDNTVIWLKGTGFTDGYTPTENTKAVYKFE